MLSTPTKLTINRVLTRAGLGPDELKALSTNIRELAQYDQVGMQIEAFMPHSDNILWNRQTFVENEGQRCDIPLRCSASARATYIQYMCIYIIQSAMS